MARTSLREAVEAVRAMAFADRGGALLALAAAATADAADGPGWTVFHPLECTPDVAARCWHAGRSMVVDGRICSALVDPDGPCPFDPGA
jgi:hypothetical protein